MTNGELIIKLYESNEPIYNLTKTIEECNELATVLSQTVNKNGTEKQPSEDEIRVEIADVQIRLQVLKEKYGELQINDLIQAKLDKYKGYLAENKYVGRI